jgi:hypothetical protein
LKTLFFILLAASLFATSTLTTLRTLSQSDGSQFQGRLQGDVFLHWFEAEDGSILLFNKKTANFEYAKIVDGDLTLSGEIYQNSTTRSLHVKRNNVQKEQLNTLWKQRHP